MNQLHRWAICLRFVSFCEGFRSFGCRPDDEGCGSVGCRRRKASKERQPTLGDQGRLLRLHELVRAPHAAADPLLVVSDGAPGIIKAIETCFPGSARQRCLAHRMRNLAAKVSEDAWPDFKLRVQAACQAPSRAIARDLAEACRVPWPASWMILKPASLICACRLPIAEHPNDQSARAFVPRGAPAAEDHPQRLRRKSSPQAHVRRDDESRRTLARRQGHRLRMTSDERTQTGTR
ncbi:MAG: hypothetical protein GY798_13115 [Hyphomicrobiales bacterium]|nr:hypothetical protein [Hyphomicrobiales bacterium]